MVEGAAGTAGFEIETFAWVMSEPAGGGDEPLTGNGCGALESGDAVRTFCDAGAAEMAGAAWTGGSEPRPGGGGGTADGDAAVAAGVRTDGGGGGGAADAARI